MKLTKKSPLTGQENEMDLPISEDDYKVAYAKWRAGVLIQDAFPTLDADQREFVKTGYTPEDWEALFG